MVKLNLEACCGCGECAALCPKGAITMSADEYGFQKPVIDAEKCISCGICTRECAVSKAESLKSPCLRVYGAQNTNEKTRLSSSSGGAFSAFAEYVLGLGGAVYGVVCERDTVKHVRITALSELAPLRGSKYVQSTLSSALYDQISQDLSNGMNVLFSGTPCQCAAVRNYVSKNKVSDEKLYIADLICHGVASPRVFADYIEHCEKKAKKQISTHIFRSKDLGWGTRHEKNVFSDGECDGKSFLSQLYKKAFYSDRFLNESCYKCRFTDIKRASDITMADFWGIDKKYPDKNNKTGVSALLVNTERGQALINAVGGLTLFDAAIADLNQQHLYRSCSKPQTYEEFWRLYKAKGFWSCMKRFYGASIFRRFVSFVSKPIPVSFKRAVKKLLKH